eukprot:TRINITY_DN9281_c0_g1_i1.p1 TRINITY_DN9281_c0_g1~~TRINITY_DN9281_c0_g1_i1.p1  ORF type:complete len:228 (-),score=58.56 TRINITY_DN9281_c0_g1_i1:65-748(-)
MMAVAMKQRFALLHEGEAPPFTVDDLYEMCKREEIPFHLWSTWIETRMLQNAKRGSIKHLFSPGAFDPPTERVRSYIAAIQSRDDITLNVTPNEVTTKDTELEIDLGGLPDVQLEPVALLPTPSVLETSSPLQSPTKPMSPEVPQKNATYDFNGNSSKIRENTNFSFGASTSAPLVKSSPSRKPKKKKVAKVVEIIDGGDILEKTKIDIIQRDIQKTVRESTVEKTF